MCNGGVVKQGSFIFTVQTSVDGAGILVSDQTQYYALFHADLDAFLYPTAYRDLDVLTHGFSNNGRTFTLNFGAISAGKRFWF